MDPLERAFGVIVVALITIFGSQRNGSNRNTGQNNRVVCLSEATNEQDQLNNTKSKTLVVVDVRGSETLQDWIINMGSQAGSNSQSFERVKIQF